MPHSIEQAQTPGDIEAIRTLLREYATQIGIDLAYQNFEPELAALPGAYAPPSGTLLLARENNEPTGCIGVRPLPTIPHHCEIKRLYTRRVARGAGLGRRLAEAALAFATTAGYHRAVLDTLPTMHPAIALYRALGFTPIPPYGNAMRDGTLCFGKTLAPNPTPTV